MKRRHSVGWSGFVHNVGLGQYLVSQKDRTCHASRFWIPEDEVFPGVWTFQGHLCLRCRKEIR